MKYIFTVLALGLFLISTSQEQRKIDSVAIDLLDKMSIIIGELSATSFTVDTATDETNDFLESERLFETHQVQMVGPDKMTVHTKGNKGSKAMWYNGELLTYYSFDENNYVTVDAPDNIITMIDSIHTQFGIKFPAADLFYPTLTDDVLEHFDTLKYLGQKTIDGEDCFHIMASSAKMTFQLWISNTAFYLPKRFLIIDKEDTYKQHQGTFTNWIINPVLPESIFDFVPPAEAKLISILEKS